MASATRKTSRKKAKKAPAKAKTRAAPAARRATRSGAKRPPKRRGAPERSAPAMAGVEDDVREFIAAIAASDAFKKQHGRPFPSWSEVLLIVRQLGYRRG